MAKDTLLKQYPELADIAQAERAQLLVEAKAAAFGPDQKLERWRGNLLHFTLMFGVSALFMAIIAPALSLSRDSAALVMLLLVLPAFFIMQQRRYQRLIRAKLAELIKQLP